MNRGRFIQDDEWSKVQPHLFRDEFSENEDFHGRRKVRKLRSKRRAGYERKRAQRDSNYY